MLLYIYGDLAYNAFFEVIGKYRSHSDRFLNDLLKTINTQRSTMCISIKRGLAKIM